MGSTLGTRRILAHGSPGWSSCQPAVISSGAAVFVHFESHDHDVSRQDAAQGADFETLVETLFGTEDRGAEFARKIA